MSNLDPHAAVPTERYGRSRGRRFDRRLGWIIASVFVVGVIIFFAFSGWQEDSRIAVQDVGSDVRSDTEIAVVFEVSADPQHQVACAVEVLDQGKGVVGWKVIEIPHNGERDHTVRTTVRTTGVPSAAQAKACWVVETDD